MKFYVASSLGNWKQVSEVSGRLEQAGWTNINNWAKLGLVSNLNSTSLELDKISLGQMQAILDSDVIIVLTPMGRGTHAELGAAVILCVQGLPKKVYLYDQTSELFQVDKKTAGIYHNNFVIKKHGDINNVVNDIIKENSNSLGEKRI